MSVFEQELTRIHYYLQIRNDVIDGCITVGNDEATTLASLAIQGIFDCLLGLDLLSTNYDDQRGEGFKAC